MKKRLAFTLIECVAALLVTTVVIVLAGMTINSLRSVTRQSLDQPIDWIICLQELESPRHAYALVNVESNAVVLRDQHTDRLYELCAQKRLYLRAKKDGGYMPVFSDIRDQKTVFKQLDQQRVYIKVERTNGEVLTGFLCFRKDS
ncbi:hypothetical protein KZE55_03765 [Limosilactobacillus panis]|uniref:competence type IV pilus minor pilin ComGF n=1 Tax=Limosilactobacillus panis TaxID=47493 RepID=UPI001C93864C|nr:competence type IV pilus minor pilin ComGF [Limosilactobacillus panis]QZN93674.1 hypothetical protein KZE55_03765 [Limosilactobacillus panis]